jgi:hypothetical protein
MLAASMSAVIGGAVFSASACGSTTRLLGLPRTVTVKPVGGDYASPKLACDWIRTQNPTPTSRFEVWIYPGIYTEIEWWVSDYTTLRGIGRPEQVWLQGEQPASVSDAVSAANSTIRLGMDATLCNLLITARNMRYPVHSDQYGANKDALHIIDGCRIEHYGNQDVIDYRVANLLPAGDPWVTCLPWGYGSASGLQTRFTNTILTGPTCGAFYMHNNQNFDKPTINTLERCRIITQDPTQPTILVSGLGSGQPDRVDIINSEVSGSNYVEESDSPWIPTTDAAQYANHSDVQLAFRHCSGPVLGWQTLNRGKALKITSASTSTISTVRVSGTAADAIFGTRPYYRDGGGGIVGYAFGDLDISGVLVGISSDTVVNNTLGRRLGNCSGASKTLTVTVNGGAPVNITFNTNLTSVANSTIIATINTALGVAATAAEYLVSQGEIYPQFVDRQVTMVNGNASVGIPRWSAVKRVSGRVQLMQPADAASLFYGVAIESIPPGRHGRILTEGLLLSSQLAGAPTVTDGAAIYHSDATAGAFSSTGTSQFGVGQDNDYCYFKGKT